MSDNLNIFLGVVAMILVGNSWYIHYVVKDGLARQILLWLNGLLFAMFFFRTVGYVLVELGYLNIYTSRTWNQYVIFFPYAIVLLQQWLQRGRRERIESDVKEADRKELKARRKKDK